MSMEQTGAPERTISVTSLEELQDLLKKYNIVTEQWGTGKSKAVNDLFIENSEGESRFIERNGSIIRHVQPLRINVFYHVPDGTRYLLREQHQFFHDGRGDGTAKERTHVASVSEKIRLSENLQDAVARALDEELFNKTAASDTHGSYNTTFKDKRLEDRDSDSYPGLQSEYMVHEFDALLSDEQYNPQGYCEVRDSKTVCFKWEKVED